MRFSGPLLERWPVALAAIALGTAGWAATSQAHVGPASHSSSDTAGHTTREQTICVTEAACPLDGGFTFLKLGPGDPYAVRTELAPARSGRSDRRRSLAYFGQITDFQLADEESPARVELFDIDPSGFASSAWRPQEALVVHEIDRSIRQMNRFIRSPVRQSDGRRARMLNAVMTGDLADNMQRNETQWVVQLLEGGKFKKGQLRTRKLDPNSGTSGASTVCPQGTPLDDPRHYTGVQDRDDFPLLAPNRTAFYDPNHPGGQYASWPKYEGLMDRAQVPFEVAGLDAPTYSVFGNHDGLVQGNEDANRPFEEVATGCVKPIAPAPGLEDPGSIPPGLIDALPPLGDVLDPSKFDELLSTKRAMLVPPDENRQFVDKRQFKRLHTTGEQGDQHGFGLVDKEELDASGGTAAYYSWSPKDGIRFIVLDTLSEGGRTPQSSDGNIDDPQWKWLQAELDRASQRNELIVVFGHHAASTSLTADVADEEAPPCTGKDEHGHDRNPGCDRDPRTSTPLHFGDDLIELFHQHPHVITYVAGHSHDNRVEPFRSSEGGDFWEIKSPAVADWPPQHRVVDVMDNRDGTLSIFATLLDHDAPVDPPRSGTEDEVKRYSGRTLASIARVLTYNDSQQGPDGSEGKPTDRNVELLIKDPRTASAGPGDGDGNGDGDGDGDGTGDGDGDGTGGGAGSAGEDATVAAGGGGESGSDLPFTGLTLLLLVLVGSALIGSGLLMKRRAAQRPGPR